MRRGLYWVHSMQKYIKAAVLLHTDNKYLLIQENKSSMAGRWNWPQGRLEEGESAEEGAMREGREETGLSFQIERKIGVLTDTFSDTSELHVFLAMPDAGVINFPSDEIRDAKWFSSDEIFKMKDSLVGEWVLETIKVLAIDI